MAPPPIHWPVEFLTSTVERLARLDPGLARRGELGRWCDGIIRTSRARGPFAEHWATHNAVTMARPGDGPLWVALGDSAAQGLGADRPTGGYVTQVHRRLRRTGRPWRVLNLSQSGATIPDVLGRQLPQLAALDVEPTLVTCGVGTNDLFRTPLPRARAQLRSLVEAVPDCTVFLDVPLPVGKWRIGGCAVPLVTRLNAELHARAADRGLPVAYISRWFTPPWPGKFGPDDFHPNEFGYRLWTRAVWEALPAGVRDAAQPARLDKVA